MKHLKTYKIFEQEDYEYIHDYVQDIIASLKDIGFTCQFEDYPSDNIFIFKVEKEIWHNTDGQRWRGNSVFKWGDIKDDMIHMLSFLKDEGNKIDNFDIDGPKMFGVGGDGTKIKSMYGNKMDELGKNWFEGVPDDLELFSLRIVFIKPDHLHILEKKSKRKIGWFAKWCHNLGYSGVKNNRCYGKKKKNVKQMDIEKDYFYDIKNGKCVIPKN